MIPKFWLNIGIIIGIVVCGLISIFAQSFSISHALLLIAGILVFIIHFVEIIPRFREVILTKKLTSLLNLSSIFHLGFIPFSLLVFYYQIIGWLSRNWYDDYTGFHGDYNILKMMSVPFLVLQVVVYLYISLFEAKGEFHWSRGEYLQALKVTNSNIERCMWVYGRKHYNTSIFIFNLAAVYHKIGEQDSIDVRKLEEALNNYTKSSLGYRQDILKFLLYIENRLDLAYFYILRNNELYGKRYLEETLHLVQKASNNKWLSLFVKSAVISSLIVHYITLNNVDNSLRFMFNKETIKVEDEIEETLMHSKNNLLKNILCNPFIMGFKEIIITLILILPCILPLLVKEWNYVSELYMLIVLIPTFLLVHILYCYWDIAYFEYRLKSHLFQQLSDWIQFKNNLVSFGENASSIEKQCQKISIFIQKISQIKLLYSEAIKTVIIAELYVMIAELKMNQIAHLNLSFHLADGMVYQSVQIANFYREAIENYDKALNFYEKINHKNIAKLNINLFNEQSNLSDSKMISKKQQFMSERYRTGYAECLIKKALAYAELQGLNEAETIITTNFSKAKDVLEISTKTHSIDSYSFQSRLSLYAQGLNKLGWLYYTSKRYEDAEIKYQEAEEICNNLVSIFSSDSLLSPKFLIAFNQIWLEITTGNPDVALNKLKESQKKFDQLLWLMISINNERVRLNLIEFIKIFVYIQFSIINHFLLGDISEIKTLFEIILQTKGISAEILATQRDKLLEKKYLKLKPQFERLRLLRKQIAQKQINGLAPLETIADFERTLELSYQEKEKLEQELAVQIPELNLELKLKNVTLQAISKALPKKYVLVEFVVLYDPIEAKEVREEYSDNPQMLLEYQPYFRYVAFVLSSDNIEMIEIGGRDRINKMIANFRSSIIGENEDRNLEVISSEKAEKKKEYRKESGIALRKAIFDPLVKNLGDCQHIFISPDGDLTRLPFEILPTDDDQQLIDNYSISYLSSGKDILRFGFKTDRQATDAIIIADPDFDYGLGQHSSSIDKELNSSGRQSRDLDLEKLEFKRLDGTRQEGIEIGSLLNVEPWLAEEAVKEKLESITSPLILHIATHGFFVEDQPETFYQEQLLSARKLPITKQENPLLRSGLALAGANWKNKQFRPPSEVGNGIITAEEVSNLDLSETELVVLSACETGLGDVQTGEGVFGLRRAFVLAGAKTLVMSLWKVPDQQTQELMTEFYRRMLWGEGRGEALRNAQLDMRQKYPNPYYWGAFICQGEINSISQ